MNNNEYFELKHLEDIYNIFNKLKEINNYYGTNIINEKNDGYDFFLFLQENLIIEEPYIDDNKNDNDEDYNNY